NRLWSSLLKSGWPSTTCRIWVIRCQALCCRRMARAREEALAPAVAAEWGQAKGRDLGRAKAAGPAEEFSMSAAESLHHAPFTKPSRSSLKKHARRNIRASVC